MSGRKELLQLLSSNQPYSISYWISLLNLFDKYKGELNISDLRMLVTECEEIREWFNENNVDKIRKEDTNPNIYVHLEMLEVNEHKKFIEYNKESLSTELVAIAQ